MHTLSELPFAPLIPTISTITYKNLPTIHCAYTKYH
jgi:hypothetical protein